MSLDEDEAAQEALAVLQGRGGVPLTMERLKIMEMNARARADKYEAAIRKHQAQRGDDRCWQDDEELYAVLPEPIGGRPALPALPPPAEMRRRCELYIQHRHNPAIAYRSPEREIERLETELKIVKDQRDQLGTTLEMVSKLAQDDKRDLHAIAVELAQLKADRAAVDAEWARQMAELQRELDRAEAALKQSLRDALRGGA